MYKIIKYATISSIQTNPVISYLILSYSLEESRQDSQKCPPEEYVVKLNEKRIFTQKRIASELGFVVTEY